MQGQGRERERGLASSDMGRDHWCFGVCAAKAAVGRFEMLDLNDMENYYYIYICRKQPQLWDLKLMKLGKKKKKKKK